MKFLCISLIIICTIFIQCVGGKRIGLVLNSIPEAELEFKLIKERGDQEFVKMHYMGWYNAVNYFDIELPKQ